MGEDQSDKTADLRPVLLDVFLSGFEVLSCSDVTSLTVNVFLFC